MLCGERGHEAAEREHQQAAVDHALAAVAVGQPSEGNLQHRLREAVGAERDADERQVVAARKLLGIDREHRQDHEHAEHAQAEDAGERRCSRAARRRVIRVGLGHRQGFGTSRIARRYSRYISRFRFQSPSMAAVTCHTDFGCRRKCEPRLRRANTSRIRGARTHNLKNINLDLPRNRLVVITGLSAPASRRSRSTRFTPKASGATSSRCRRTRASSCS